MMRRSNKKNAIAKWMSWTIGLMAAMWMVACGPGKAATGTMTVTLEVQAASPLVVDGWTISLTKAFLHLESVEILGGEHVTEHSHDEKKEEKQTASGGLKVTGEHKLLDLLQKNMELVKNTAATAGDYSLFAMSFANAEEGDTKGYLLWLEGTAEKGTDKKSFAIQWAVDKALTDFIEFKSDIKLATGGTTNLTVRFDAATLFAGIDWVAASANAGKVVIDKTTNSALLSKVQENLKKSFTLQK